MLIREFRQGSALDLRNKQLTDISPKLWTHTDLTELDLSQNPGIVTLPEDIDLLINLKKLRVCGNGLVNLPTAILNLRHLGSLELNQNKLAQFFEIDDKTRKPIQQSQVHLDNLSYLSLNGNQITCVPSVCKYMRQLRQLHLHVNRLTDVRELCRKEFEHLEVLDIGNNKIREIPIALVFYLANLNMLAMVNNDVTSMPSWIGFHNRLSTL